MDLHDCKAKAVLISSSSFQLYVISGFASRTALQPGLGDAGNAASAPFLLGIWLPQLQQHDGEHALDHTDRDLEEGAPFCPRAVRSASRQPFGSSTSKCSQNEHTEASNPFLSLNFLPGASSCAGELCAVNQRVKHARTALALQVSGSCRCFPREYGKCKHLKGIKCWI